MVNDTPYDEKVIENPLSLSYHHFKIWRYSPAVYLITYFSKIMLNIGTIKMPL